MKEAAIFFGGFYGGIACSAAVVIIGFMIWLDSRPPQK